MISCLYVCIVSKLFKSIISTIDLDCSASYLGSTKSASLFIFLKNFNFGLLKFLFSIGGLSIKFSITIPLSFILILVFRIFDGIDATKTAILRNSGYFLPP